MAGAMQGKVLSTLPLFSLLARCQFK